MKRTTHVQIPSTSLTDKRFARAGEIAADELSRVIAGIDSNTATANNNKGTYFTS